MSKRHRALYDGFRAILTNERNSAVLRERIRSASYPKLPYLGIYLSELVFADDGNKTFVNEERGVINFHKAVLHARAVVTLMQCQAVPYQIVPVLELMELLQSCRGFENHEQAAYQLSRSIDGMADQQMQLPAQVAISDAYQTSVKELQPAQQSNEDFEIALLNSRSLVVLHNTSMFDRGQLWRSWIRMLRSQQDFRRALLQSEVLENSATALVKRPPNTSELDSVRDLFAAVLSHLSADIIGELMNVLQRLSACRLTSEHLKAVSALVTFLKPVSSFSFQGVDQQQLDEHRNQLSVSSAKCRELLATVQNLGVRPKPADLVGRIAELSQLNQYFGGLVESLDADHNCIAKASFSSATEDALLRLTDYLQHLPVQTVDRINNLEQQRVAVTAQAEQSEADLADSERSTQEELRQLQERKEALERELQQVNRTIRTKKKDLASIQEQTRRSSRRGRKSIATVEQNLAFEKAFLERLSDSQFSSELEALPQFLATHTFPLQQERDRKGTVIIRLWSSSMHDFLSSAVSLLDLELLVSTTAAQTLLEWHRKAKSLIQDLREAAQTPQLDALSSFLPVEKTQLELLEKSRLRTESLRSAVLDKAGQATLPPPSDEHFLQITAKFKALDSIFDQTINSLPSIASLVVLDEAS